MAFASGAELETQLVISQNLSLVGTKDAEKITAQLDEIMRMLNTMTSEIN